MYKSLFVFAIITVAIEALCQVEVDYTLKMTIHPSQALINLHGGEEILECSNTGGIISLTCGFNSTVLGPQLCGIDDSQSFGIDYTVENVDSCWGTDGTPEWQGALPPFAGGSGSFTKTIDNGITQDTTFALNCQQENQFTYQAKVAKFSYLEFYNEDNFRGTIIWFKEHLQIMKYTEENKGQYDVVGYPHDSEFKPFLVVTDTKPVVKNGELVEYKQLTDNGACNNLAGDQNIAHINVGRSKLLNNTCQMDPDKPYYLIKILFHAGKKSGNLRPAMKLQAN